MPPLIASIDDACDAGSLDGSALSIDAVRIGDQSDVSELIRMDHGTQHVRPRLFAFVVVLARKARCDRSLSKRKSGRARGRAMGCAIFFIPTTHRVRMPDFIGFLMRDWLTAPLTRSEAISLS